MVFYHFLNLYISSFSGILPVIPLRVCSSTTLRSFWLRDSWESINSSTPHFCVLLLEFWPLLLVSVVFYRLIVFWTLWSFYNWLCFYFGIVAKVLGGVFSMVYDYIIYKSFLLCARRNWTLFFVESKFMLERFITFHYSYSYRTLCIN